jgi:hypothetical protein
MMSEDLHYLKLERELKEAFPSLSEGITVVIDAGAPEAARRAAERVAERVKQTGLFEKVSLPRGGEFFEQNGLLYLSLNELQDLSDNLADVQPFLGLLTEDLSLRGLFSVLEKIMSSEEVLDQKEKLVPLFDRLDLAFGSAASGSPYSMSWQELVIGEKAAKEMSRQFIVLEPVMDETSLFPAEDAIDALHRIRNELGLNGEAGVRMRLTGGVVLDHENLLAAESGTGLATVLSFLLVTGTLFVGMGSVRLVLSSMITITVGLIWTLGFALGFIGHLNLVSVSFGVLFIGLSDDYAIQLCLRYRELILEGCKHHEAIVRAAKGVGDGLLLCTLTTAIGFYSFLPTAYTGVSELGLIAGTGMLINLFTNLTLLPALLALFPVSKEKVTTFSPGKGLYAFPYKHQRAVSISAVVLALAAASLLPKTFFDYNPINLYDPHSESVSTMRDLFRDKENSPWTISVIAKNDQEARKLTDGLKQLPEVKEAITVDDLVPADQQEKLDLISTIGLFVPLGLDVVERRQLPYGEQVASLDKLEVALDGFMARTAPDADGFRDSVQRLRGAVGKLRSELDEPRRGEQAFARLDEALLANLPILFDDLQSAMKAHAFSVSDLPAEVLGRYVSADGRYRVEVYPREDIFDHDALERFVDAVTAVAPDATDTPVSILEAGRAVVRSFVEATIYALIAITLVLLYKVRNLPSTALILLPLLLALDLTVAASVALSIPFNFANVIIVPLLLGIGVNTGIHFIHRFRTEPPANNNMLETSTAGAVFFATLTTTMSFGTLAFSPHQGMASMGKLLALCMTFLTLTTFFLLPVLLKACESCKLEPLESDDAD